VKREAFILSIKLFISTESFKKIVDIKNANVKIRKFISLSKVLRNSLSFLRKKRFILFLIIFLKIFFVSNTKKKVDRNAK
jgi:hypothetical protein